MLQNDILHYDVRIWLKVEFSRNICSYMPIYLHNTDYKHSKAVLFKKLVTSSTESQSQMWSVTFLRRAISHRISNYIFPIIYLMLHSSRFIFQYYFSRFSAQFLGLFFFSYSCCRLNSLMIFRWKLYLSSENSCHLPNARITIHIPVSSEALLTFSDIFLSNISTLVSD